jgi:hypothetical protein
MFDSHTKEKYIKLLIIKRIFVILFALFIATLNLYLLIGHKFLFDHQKEGHYLIGGADIDIIMINCFFAIFIGSFSMIYESIVRSILYSCFVYETLYIINTAKLPDKLPKVVYVYTTHNDFLPGRVLQNAKQTYKNFEI